MSPPLPLGTTLKCALNRSISFSKGEFTQILGAGLGSMAELSLQCSPPVETKKLNKYNNLRKALNSAEAKFTGLTISFCVWMDLTKTLPFLNLIVVDTVNQVPSAM